MPHPVFDHALTDFLPVWGFPYRARFSLCWVDLIVGLCAQQLAETLGAAVDYVCLCHAAALADGVGGAQPEGLHAFSYIGRWWLRRGSGCLESGRGVELSTGRCRR